MIHEHAINISFFLLVTQLVNPAILNCLAVLDSYAKYGDIRKRFGSTERGEKCGLARRKVSSRKNVPLRTHEWPNDAGGMVRRSCKVRRQNKKNTGISGMAKTCFDMMRLSRVAMISSYK